MSYALVHVSVPRREPVVPLQNGRGRLSRAAGQALWAAILGGLFPLWFLKMAEFRTDVLWTTFWLVDPGHPYAAGQLTVRRHLCCQPGFSASAFSVSMKIDAHASSRFARPRPDLGRGNHPPGEWPRPPSPGRPWLPRLQKPARPRSPACSLVPGAFVTFFVSKGVGKLMYYCVIQHNLTPGAHHFRAIVHGFSTIFSGGRFGSSR